MIITKSLFLPSVLIWRKTRKRKPWTLSFIEEAWICRTGAIFQRFSVKRRQAGSDREVRVTLKRRSGKKKMCPAEQAQFIAFFRQTEASSKRARRVRHARKEEYKKRKANQLYPVPTPIIQANFSKKWEETLDYVSCFSLHFFRALAASCVLYNRTEHSQGFSIC